MAKEILLEVITPSKAGYSGMVNSVTLPGASGMFQVLFNHAPMISSLDVGIVKIIEQGGKESLFATSGGTVEVLENKILLLAETFESADQIDVQRAKSAMDRAKERLAVKYKPDIDEVRAEAALKKAINRIKLVETKI